VTAIERLLTAIQEPARPDRDRLAHWLDQRSTELAAAYPELRLDMPAFASYLGEKVARAPDVMAALDSLHVADLYLAWACAEGDRVALSLLDRKYLTRVRAWARGNDPAELEQAVRVRLLVPDSDACARIRQYSGRGPLSAWLRMTATRVAIDLARSAKSFAEPPGDLASLTTPVDPEIDYLKMRYAGHFRAAIELALGSLPPKETALLKLCYLENASAAAIARMYGVSLRTAQRWLVEAREHLLASTREALAEALALPPSELDSLMLLVHSQLHVSLHRVLAAST
jgi:RNA polymerase sigma-70 factor (ECF subfamily)